MKGQHLIECVECERSVRKGQKVYFREYEIKIPIKVRFPGHV